MNTKKSIRTDMLADKLSKTEKGFFSFTGQEIGAIIAALELVNDMAAANIIHASEEKSNTVIVETNNSILQKIEDVFNEELQAQKIDEMLQQLKEREYNERVKAFHKNLGQK